MFGARFDDVTRGESFVLTEPIEALVAVTLTDVRDVVEAAAGAARDGRWVAGYVTYEAAPAFDDAFVVRPTERRPLVWFGVFERRESVPVAVHDPRAGGAYSISKWSPVVDRRKYASAFLAVKDHIRNDDIDQVNFTFPLRAAFTGSAEFFYNDLVCAQRPSYATHIWHDDVHVVSVSPERFFSIEGRTITTQPMNGTALRGRWLVEDLERRDGLEASESDRAEGRVIVDLLRDDLGRVAEKGSIEIDDPFAIDRYRTVWQMTSKVRATARRDVTLQDIFEALFPSGSVTGAPKVSSMRTIADLEQEPRGVYCGAVGFIPPGDGFDGASFNVAIRTVEIDEAEGVARYGVGGAVTWDSTLEGEFDEAVTKSEVLRFDVSTMQLIESVRWDGEWLWLDDHISNLDASAAYWGFDIDCDAVAELLEETARTFTEPTIVRVVVNQDGSVFVGADAAPLRWRSGPGPVGEPVSLALDTEPIDDRSPRVFHKTSDRRSFTFRAQRHPGCEDVVMVNRAGNVTESGVANVAFLIDGRWLTPPVSDGLVAGVMRGRLVEDGVLEVRSISIADALNANAVALVSVVHGWRPAVIVDAGQS